MKKIFIICLFLSFIAALQAQYDKSCYFGFTFEVSKNPNWGYGELVITEVEPNSPAEKTGIKVGDIIMEINRKATYLRDNQTIASWLFDDMYAPTVNFTIRNMNTYFKEYTLKRECIATNSVSERQLSQLFSFYSIENTYQRDFVLPLRVEPNKDVEYTDYHSFDFYKEESEVPFIDNEITALLEKELLSKGLVRDTSDPEIVVQAYYSYAPNPQFTALNNPNYTPGTWRFDSNKQKMTLLGIFNPGEKDAEKNGQYIVEYGFSFYDRKYIDTKKLTQIWDCNIKDYLSSQYSLAEYVRLHTPLMLMQFPFTTAKTEAKYRAEFNKYNYTGMHFDADDLVTVKDVDPESPAFIAGIRPGYVIKKLNNVKFEHTKATLSEAYKRFISETFPYRDITTRFTNSEGYADCMYWDIGHYPEILKAFGKSDFQTHFSYLYGFEKYINNKEDDKIYIEAWDGRQIRKFVITPQIRNSVIVKVL